MNANKKQRGSITRTLIWMLPRPLTWFGTSQIKGLGQIIVRSINNGLPTRKRVQQTWGDAIQQAANRLQFRTQADIDAHLAVVRQAMATKAWVCYLFCLVSGGFSIYGYISNNWMYFASLLAVMGVLFINGLASAFRVWQIDHRQLGGNMTFLRTITNWFPR